MNDDYNLLYYMLDELKTTLRTQSDELTELEKLHIKDEIINLEYILEIRFNKEEILWKDIIMIGKVF